MAPDLVASAAMMARWSLVGLAVALLALGGCEREQKAIEEDLPAARATRARADAQQIASAVRLYQSAFGALPESLDALTRSQAAGGVTAGPFLAAIPAPPAGWSGYQYTRHGADQFTISSSGGGATVTAP
jgi:hypothetical protein